MLPHAGAVQIELMAQLREPITVGLCLYVSMLVATQWVCSACVKYLPMHYQCIGTMQF